MIVKVTSKRQKPPNFGKRYIAMSGSCWVCKHYNFNTKKCLKYKFRVNIGTANLHICDDFELDEP